MVLFESEMEAHWRNICESTSPEVTPNDKMLSEVDEDVLDGLGSVDNPSPLDN